jgi:phosphoribosylaminoimidazolecarboxamide formyltransferase/IMP cyclohydrolase
MTRALLSVHDKTGLVDFARGLLSLGVELVASGGTARALADAGLTVTTVESLTGFPALLDGRVKTLHPAIHAGILSRRSTSDEAELTALGLRHFDLVAVSLYPFEDVFRSNFESLEDQDTVIESIDIGGVALLRAAAKNHAHVLAVPGPAHYDEALAALHGDRPLALTRARLAAAAFAQTAAHDASIAAWLAERAGAAAPVPGAFRERTPLRYGENPHQDAAYLEGPGGPTFKVRSGKPLSYNNLLDLDAAASAVADFAGPTCVVVKHGSPCGIATSGHSVAEAVARAIAADPTSAFGGILAVNQPFDLAAVDALGDLFLEVIAAPSFADGVVERLAKSRKNCRVLELQRSFDRAPLLRSAVGGLLVQGADTSRPAPDTWKVHGDHTAVDEALGVFALTAVKHVKSNAIVVARRDGDVLVTVGIGGGQTNRIDAVAQALHRAGEHARGATLASDAFFPFADGVEAAARAGVGVVYEPGGALRDEEVIAAAARLGVALVLTGTRHFRH